MKLLSYQVFVIINLVVSLSQIVLPWVLDSQAELNSKLAITFFGLVNLVFLLLSKEKGFNALNILSKKITVLVLFISNLILSFTPYLLSYTAFRNLVILAIGTSAITLLTLVFSNLSESEANK